MSSFSKKVRIFFKEQLEEWYLAAKNYEALKQVKTKTFHYGDFDVKVQFNPARLTSGLAKTDPQSIRERKCFLCPANRPAEQRSLPFGENYLILVNPYPIFPVHLTIPELRHVNQRIHGRFADMLAIAEALPDFVVFYNGPKSGASAPDHMHFQAGNKGFLPLEKDLKFVEKETLFVHKNTQLYTLKNYLRNIFVLESQKKEDVIDVFEKIEAMLPLKEGDQEPMMNIVVWYDADTWTTCIMPRQLHRPSCFFAEGEENLLISPGSVDLGGVIITPREKDFEKITAATINTIFKEVCVTDDIIEMVKQKMDH
jgi:ATP adenylyltransferase/5',5'''-P-1,P-4-tetraphosphate phosphorylase II